ncbi:MAG: phosphonate metabolism transcriptional regulator PhnF [Alphaproteobacteria bacterium]|nr:phosphonate metabolism transcriptional regulator PhnF [Alphaproteobacteria bacterium]MBU0797947.1 phosphonate metabolism transcriptional regulator PhnF [Alphaproteobacteria bacterium]MBU0886101.1 phosphonate metabolism transcriptional regulator PhnF [Alphaproteobacteria bacterium]MBU1812741.1 phosphonate metabolism transcriptional regulator PhnF [Alphaproteobacteria bacterium]MBU2091896.1 phosphonate metabolism transcriptional regulator PhnF [Alphaproteobacteria bacterium]
MEDDISLSRRAGIALWRQIEEAVTRDIAQGRFQPGDRLPTEKQLSDQFKVNRHTLRRAMEALEARGLIRIEQGRGSFVQEHVLDYTLGARTRFSEIVSAQNRIPGGRLIDSAQIRAEGEIAKLLELPFGTPCTLLRTVHDADGRPITYSHNYFPSARFPNAAAVYGEFHSVTRMVQAHGVADYKRKLTRITARMPTEDEAAMLAQPRNRPVLLAEAVDADLDGVPIRYGYVRFASERVQLVFDTPTG